MPKRMFGWAPDELWQSINPWRFFEKSQFSFFTLNFGNSGNPEAEEAILDDVGSYGRQLGRIGDALEVVVNHLKIKNPTDEELDALEALRIQLAEIRKVKAKYGS